MRAPRAVGLAKCLRRLRRERRPRCAALRPANCSRCVGFDRALNFVFTVRACRTHTYGTATSALGERCAFFPAP
jgi:hypothetical protein